MQSISIGRHPNCDIVLGDAHVSRRHASIYFTEGAFHLHNRSATNPILFNDQWPISKNLKADLQIGDSFIIGRVRLKVVPPDAAQNGNGPGANGNMKARCPSCENLMDFGLDECNWCRTSLAEAEMVELEPEVSFRDQ
jgi:predicted component of type VI protein secretion system